VNKNAQKRFYIYENQSPNTRWSVHGRHAL